MRLCVYFSSLCRLALGSLAVGLFVIAPWLRGAAPAATEDKPLQMEPVLVSTIYTSIRMRPVFRKTPSEHDVVAMLRIEDVRRKSPAERAGLQPGFEILAINGMDVRGLDELELDKLWRGPFFEDILVLRVAAIRPGLSASRPYDIRIPLKKEPPITVEFTVQVGGEKPSADSPAKK